MIASDAIVIVVTWIKTWSTIRVAKQLRMEMSFTSLVLNEGILYFCIVLSLNVVQIVFDFVEVGNYSLILPFLNVFTPILISRFFLDLDDLSTQDGHLAVATSSGENIKEIGSTLRFHIPGSAVSSHSSYLEHSHEDNLENINQAEDAGLYMARNAYRSPGSLKV
uniref:Methyltransf_11 domain-containing protein n=1 Tax=Ganoderma boninense TaxID=34458 RepID=A0A5K1JZR7_9APHY|nr:Methyltransf_11 domain-containing protein [Ganoderma boninense]